MFIGKAHITKSEERNFSRAFRLTFMRQTVLGRSLSSSMLGVQKSKLGIELKVRSFILLQPHFFRVDRPERCRRRDGYKTKLSTLCSSTSTRGDLSSQFVSFYFKNIYLEQ